MLPDGRLRGPRAGGRPGRRARRTVSAKVNNPSVGSVVRPEPTYKVASSGRRARRAAGRFERAPALITRMLLSRSSADAAVAEGLAASAAVPGEVAAVLPQPNGPGPLHDTGAHGRMLAPSPRWKTN